MSCRETLGVTPSTETPYTHNSQNTQKPIERGNCADIADSAYRDSKEADSKLLETLADTCRELDITPAEVKESLAEEEDIEDWCKGTISADALAAFSRSLAQRRNMEQGKRPAHYTEQSTCKHCGPIWLWFSDKVLGCPWCWNRIAEKPIPRPCPVRCTDCIHFDRIDHPHLGHCAKGKPEAVTGLWDTDRQYCGYFLPRPQQTNDDQQRPTRVETKE